MPITRRQLAAMEWELIWSDDSSAVVISVYRSKSHENFAIIHQKAKTPGARTKITYNVYGRKTDSPSDAVKRYNETEKDRLRGRPILAGSVESLAQRKGNLP